MKKRRSSNLWFYFVTIIFFILLFSSALMGGLALYAYHLGYFEEGQNLRGLPFLMLLAVSTGIGTAIFMVVARRIMMPLSRFSKAVKEVAKGNFQVRLDENERLDELREFAHDFNVMTHELSSIETLRNDFVLNVSHEFKTPLAGIRGYATLLLDKGLSQAEYEEYARHILDGAKQLSALTEGVLTLSKLENQEMLSNKTTFRVDEQIRQALLLLEPEWSKKQLELDIDLQKAYFCGNEALMMQVWTNLTGNAIKFTPENGRIRVCLIRTGDLLQIEVTDNGIGMSGEVLSHIFDKFYQGDRARAVEGNGLGLPLVKRILDLSEGEIHVTSSPGQGATFLVVLKACQGV